MATTMPLKPRMTEKTYGLSESRVYVFDVPVEANKSQVIDAVTDQFKVTVEDARLLIHKGKKARSIRIGGQSRRQVYGRRPDVKKAYVTVKEGDKIPIFDAIEEAEAKQKAAEEKAASAVQRKATKAENKKPAAKSTTTKKPAEAKKPKPAKKEVKQEEPTERQKSLADRLFRRKRDK
jgi:large subunit ribosomal protein L23